MNAQIEDAITEVESAIKSLPDGSVEKMLMVEVKASLSVAQSLVLVVNTMRLAALLNGGGDESRND